MVRASVTLKKRERERERERSKKWNQSLLAGGVRRPRRHKQKGPPNATGFLSSPSLPPLSP